MPELPEVETVANGVHQRVQGKVIDSVWTSNQPQTFKSSPASIAKTLAHAKILGVRRVGKSIVMDLLKPDKEQAQFIVHLGMTGRLLVSTPEITIARHTHAVLTLSDGRELRFVDPRRFGRLSVVEDATEGGYVGPGKEPLTISLEDFILLFAGRKMPIKAALLNQSLLHGVGNIYADESLFRAGIRPRKRAGQLTRLELTRLYRAIRSVLKHAIRLGGSSVSDYVDAEGSHGFFQLEHRVYMRTGKPCLVCKTPIKRILLAGRGTHFCTTCQH